MKLRAGTDEVRAVRGMPDTAVTVTQADEDLLVWLLKGGMTPEAADKYGMRWHPPSKRLLIPIRDAKGKLSGILGRSATEKPKYLMLQGSPGLHYERSGFDGGTLVVVEDVLSAIHVAKAGYNCVALIGKSISHEQAVVFADYRFVVSFTDPDAGGDEARKVLRKRAALYDCKLLRAYSEVDPKYLTQEEIRDAVRKALNDRPNPATYS
jgi:DNA primase